MKTLLIKTCLLLLRKFALIRQVGNRAGRAPSLICKPEESEKVFGPFGDKNDLFVWRLYNVICSGLYGGAIINKFNKLYVRFSSFPWGNELHPSLSFPYLGREVTSINKAIYLITPEAEGNYYHWITDLLPRLLILEHYNLNDIKERSIIIHGKIKSYELDSLMLLGIDKSKIIRLKSFEFIKINDLIVVDYCGLNIPFPIWKKDLLRKINFNNTAEKKKIYLLRGKQAKRRLINEDILISVLKQWEFDIIDPQQLTFAEQVNLLEKVEVVVALHGAALTNIIFCKPKTHIIELRSNHLAPEYYSAIADTFDLKFDSVSLPPKKLEKKDHIANKQSLVLTAQSISMLTTKLSELYE